MAAGARRPMVVPALAGAALALAACAAPAPASRGALPSDDAPRLVSTPAPVSQPDASGLPAPVPCRDATDWNEPTVPRHVHGNTWYVGSCGIAVLLVATSAGHVLIDSGTADFAPRLLGNLRALGIDPRDIRVLLSSHEHLDHVGGMAAVQAATGAPLVARPAAVPALRRGRGDRDDPQFGSIPGFAPVADVRELADGDSLDVGGTRFTVHATPGHTPGATTWTWDSCEAGRCRHMVYADSLTAISDDDYRFVGHPQALSAFRAGLDALAALPCDILLTPHPGASGLWPRLRGEAPLLGSGACRDYAEAGRRGLAGRLARENSGAAP